MHRRTQLGLWIVLLLALSGYGYSAQAQDNTPTYEPAKCKFDPPERQHVECGFLSVPEDRSDPQSPTIKIAVAVFKAVSKHPKPDPIIYLDGGPGGHSLDTAGDAFDAAFERLGQDRDFIMFDQRGVGYSEPSLDCPEETQAIYDGYTQRMSFEERTTLQNDGLQECHDRLVADGVNLSAYNSAEDAADVNDLRIALGYDQWNLYGISYGTRLALTIMRDFPQGVRSVILDSTVPLQVDLYGRMPANADRAFKFLFESCRKSWKCNEAYPHLDRVFYDQVDKLNQRPATIIAEQPHTGKKFRLLIDGHDFIEMLYGSLYSNEVIVYLPKIIFDASHGSYWLLERYMAGTLVKKEYFSTGMYYSVQCAEEVSFDDLQTLQEAMTKFPNLGESFDMTQYYKRCQIWDVKPASAIENEPVTSSLPTLVMSGAFDPITPPAYGSMAAKTLDHSFYFEFPGVGHGASVSDECPFQVAVAFLNNPTKKPNVVCISGMRDPNFFS